MQRPGASLNAGRPVVWRSCRKANPSGCEPRECRRAGVGRGVLELLLDAQQLVVLVDTLTTGGGARLDLPAVRGHGQIGDRSEEHTSELQSRGHLVCRLLLE